MLQSTLEFVVFVGLMVTQTLNSGQVATVNPPTGRCPEEASSSQSEASIGTASVVVPPKKAHDSSSLRAESGVSPDFPTANTPLSVA